MRGRTTQHFHFLFEELAVCAKLTQLSGLRTRGTAFLALFDVFLTEPFAERADVNAEVFRDLRECHFWAKAQRDLHEIVAELFGVTRGPGFILAAQQKLAMLNVTSTCI
nr:hypothetical protein [Leucobacter komagatae]